MSRLTPFTFLIACLATWRVAALLVREDGPFGIVARARRGVRNGMNVRVLECFYCTSLWVALPLAYWLTGLESQWLVAWFAIGGGAGILEHVTVRPSPEPILELEQARVLVDQRRG